MSNTIIEILATVFGLYICHVLTKICTNLSYRSRYEQSQNMVIRKSEQIHSMNDVLNKRNELIIKLQGDNIALQKLNAHHIREIEKLKNKPDNE